MQAHSQTALRHPSVQLHQFANSSGHFYVSLHQAAIAAQTIGGIAFGLLILIAAIYGIGVSLAIMEARRGPRIITTVLSRMQAAGITILRVYAMVGWYGPSFHKALKWIIVTGFSIETGLTAVTMILSSLGVSEDSIMLLYGMTLIEMTLPIFAMLAAQSVSHILRERPNFALKWT